MDLLEVFEDSADLVRLPSGSVLFKEGDAADFMYVIIEGDIQLSLHGQQLARVGAGAVIGEMAILSSDARSATATAATDCRLAPIDEHSFKSLIQYTPEFAFHIMKVLADRLRRANAALVGNNAG